MNDWCLVLGNSLYLVSLAVEGGGLLLRCPKCSITYRSRASMKNHTAVCKAGGAAEKDCDAGADKLGCVRQAKEGIAINDVHVTAYVPKRA